MKNDVNFALYYALEQLVRIGEIAEEVSDHNYLDSTTIDLCADIGLEIQSVFDTLKEEAPEYSKKYFEDKAQALAEEMHP
jgi:hypothetical protein